MTGEFGNGAQGMTLDKLAAGERGIVRAVGGVHVSAFDSQLSETDVEHPRIGEGGRFHSRADEDPLPDDAVLTFALAGNQNCGKTTLFNQLTGSNQRAVNFPGATVDRKEGPIKGHEDTNVVDLPGIYSMSPYSAEEIVSRQFILDEKPTDIINIVDASNIKRNLYLTMQLMELDVPMALALNMMDEAQDNDGSIRVNEMEAMLGIAMAVVIGAVSHRIAFKGEAVPFVMELPQYRMPSAKSVGRLIWDRSKEFVTRAFTVIFTATLVVWFLQSFSLQLELADDAQDSILALVSGWLAPLFAPLGFGDWRFVTARVGEFLTKETVVSTLSVLFDGTAALAAVLTPAAALAFLVFCLLYTPCVA